MSQVIEVRLMRYGDFETMDEKFTVVKSRTDPHREAVELALSAWSNGYVTLKEMTLEEDVEQGKHFLVPARAWRYFYRLTIGGQKETEEDMILLAALFAEYPQKTE